LRNIGDISAIEKVQRRATKMIKSIRNKPYEERCSLLGLTSLHVRRWRGDMIEIYKLTRGLEHVSLTLPLTSINAQSGQGGPSSAIRGHAYKLNSEHTSSSQRNNFAQAVANRDHFLPNRIRPFWNKLPPAIAEAKSLNSFKALLDKLISANPNFFIKTV
jgi:hypothetical protein